MIEVILAENMIEQKDVEHFNKIKKSKSYCN